jgi:tetratricopeptide (TPR) repeat protein
MFPTISLCMIARDEEDWIDQCIRSVQPIICETILVDTGSKDRTVEIAQALGAKIFHRAWDDDFSAPRNLSIEKAAGEWILVLDADEAIAPGDLETLQRLTLNPLLCYQLNQRHYSADVRLSAFRPVQGEYPAWERHYPGYFESGLVRLFPRAPELRYEGRVHELVEHSISRAPQYRIQLSKVPIHHYGHTEEVRRKKNKSTIYTPLGTAKLKDNPVDWKAYFELGVEHNVNGRRHESIAAFRESIRLNANYVPTWVNMGYVLCEVGSFAEAEQAQKQAMALDPRASEAYCNLGVVYLRTQRFGLAERAFRAAISLDPNYINAYCNLGKAIASQQRFPEAANIYHRALDLMPSCVTAKVDLGILYSAAKVWDKAEFFLSDVVRQPSAPNGAWYQLAQIYKLQNKTADAVRLLGEFIERESAQPQLGLSAQKIDDIRTERLQLEQSLASRSAVTQ